MPVIRTYECMECGVQYEAFLDNASDPDPDCPECSTVMEWRPGMFAVKTNASRAMDITQAVLEQDYGVTNLNDRQREGDVAALSTPESKEMRDTKSQVEEIVKAELAARPDQANPAVKNAMSNFWGGNTMPTTMSAATVLAGAKQGPPGVNPMRHLHRGIESGAIPDLTKSMRRNIIARG